MFLKVRKLAEATPQEEEEGTMMEVMETLLMLSVGAQTMVELLLLLILEFN